MDIKDYLNQYRNMVRLADNLQSEIEQLENRLTSVKSTIGDGMPKAPSPGSSLEKLHAELADKIREKKAQLLQAEWKRVEVEELIDAVTDPVYHRLLRDRYSNLLEWEDVTTNLHYRSCKYVRSGLHKKALQAAQEVLDSETNVRTLRA